MKNLENLVQMEKLLTPDALKQFDTAAKTLFDDFKVEDFSVAQIEDFFKMRISLLYEQSELHDNVSAGGVFKLEAEFVKLSKDVNRVRNTLRNAVENLEFDPDNKNFLLVATPAKNLLIAKKRYVFMYADGTYCVKASNKKLSVDFDDIDDCVDYLIDNKFTIIHK